MPLFMLKKQYFEQVKSGRKDVELRNVQPQWKNAMMGDEAVLMSGKDNIIRKRILRIHRGSLARIFQDVDYKRIIPEAKTIFDARSQVKKLYPDDEEFMAFELDEYVESNTVHSELDELAEKWEVLPPLQPKLDFRETANIKKHLEERHNVKLPEVKVSYSDSIESAFHIAALRLPRFVSKETKQRLEAKWRNILKMKGLKEDELERSDPSISTIFLPRRCSNYPARLYGALWHEFGHVLARKLDVRDRTHSEGLAFACGFRGLLLEALEGKFTIEEAVNEIEHQIRGAETSFPFYPFFPHRSALRVIKEYNVERGCFEDWKFRNRNPHTLIAELDEKIHRAVRDDREVREIVTKRKIANAEKPFVTIMTIIITILLTYSIISNLI